MIRQILILPLLISSAVNSQVPPDPPLFQSNFHTGLYSVSYFFFSQASVRYIVEDPLNPSRHCVINTAQHNSTSTPGSDRQICYSYSDDCGQNWTPSVITEESSQGFPYITISNGIPVISASQSGSGISGKVLWKDSIFGASSSGQLPG